MSEISTRGRHCAGVCLWRFTCHSKIISHHGNCGSFHISGRSRVQKAVKEWKELAPDAAFSHSRRRRWQTKGYGTREGQIRQTMGRFRWDLPIAVLWGFILVQHLPKPL